MSQIYSRCILSVLCCWVMAGLSAQEVLITQGGSVSTCAATFLDRGGKNGNHSPAGNRETITICSTGDDADKTHIQLAFSVIDIQGTLTFFNGPNDQSDTLRQIGRQNNGDRISVSATAANASGCITVVFESTGTKPGWEADIRCIAACQPIVAELAASVPAVLPADNGYIDVCPGDPITLTGSGSYPENNSKYPQSDARSTFAWNFQDGTTASGQTVTHRFTEPGGYLIELDITDEKGCRNSNSLSQRVRVAGPPTVTTDVRAIPILCPGDSLRLGLNGATNNDVDFTVTPTVAEFNARQPTSDSVAIPGNSDELTQSILRLRDFAPGQRLTSSDAIEEICVTLEHSFIGDLSIWIECPDGQRINFLRSDPTGNGATNQRFGYPDRNPTGPGEPLTYCFSVRGARTVAQVAQSLQDNPGAPPTMPANLLYRPIEGSFDNFVGCELNGDWSLNVIDYYAEDDGTIFSWSIKFGPNLVPPRETFTVPVVSTYFADSGIHAAYAPDQVTYRAENPGFANQRIVSLDSIGCLQDTLIPVQVRSPFSPLCFSCPPPIVPEAVDTVVCAGEPFTPNLFPDVYGKDEHIRWEALTDRRIFTPDYSPTAPFESVITVTDQVPTTFTDATADIGDVCLNYSSTTSLSGLEVALVSPDGRKLTLVPRGSLTGPSVDRCFTPDGSPMWQAISGSRVNGAWTLQLSDLTADAAGTLESWSIDLVRRPAISYSWSPASPDFSCTNCANPTIRATQDGQYTLTTRTSDGCTASASIAIVVKNFASTFATQVSMGCAGQDNGSITLTPLADVTDLTYLWSTGATTQSISGLSAGDYQLTITASNGCSKESTYRIAPAPPLVILPRQVTNVSCNGTATGSIRTTISGGTPPYTYRWNDPALGTGGVADALVAGTYTLVVTDAGGCSTTLSQVITEPDSLVVSLTSGDVSCLDGDDGSVSATPVGGTPDYTYRWSNGATTAANASLRAGTYGLTVTDANGCTVTGSAEVREPASALTVSLVELVPGCAGASDTRATAAAGGGGGGYTFSWSSAETGPTAIALTNGEQAVTVVDANGCTVTLPISVQTKLPVVPEIRVERESPCDPRLPIFLGVQDTFATYQWSTGATSARIGNLRDGETYRLTVTDLSGCSGERSYSYLAPKPVSFTFVTTPVQCFGTPTGGLTVSEVVGPGPAPYTLTWGAGARFASGPTITDRAAGRYTLSITDAAGCTLDTVLTIPGPALLRVKNQVAPITCFDAGDGAVAATAEGGSPPYSYTWSDGSVSPALTGLGPGTYTLTVTDANTCSTTTSATLDNPREILVEASTIPGTCGGEASGRIDIFAEGGREPFLYSINNSNFTGTPRKVGYTNGVYVIRVRDAEGCLGRDTVEVDNTPAFQVDLGEDIDLTFGDSVTLSAELIEAVGEVDYFWSGSYAGTLSCPDCASPVAQPPYAIDYTLVAIDELGCEATDRLTVRVVKIREVAVPTGFTPDDDGHNDRLLVHGRPGTQVIEFLIFDRWGGLLYQDADFAVNDPSRGWDGMTAGSQPVNGGVYLYKLTVEYEDSSRETLSGQTTLIR